MGGKNNIYDVLIILLIVFLIFGTLGDAFQPIRILILFLLPLAIFTSQKTKNILLINRNSLLLFFIIFLYSIISLSWSISISKASKVIIYNIINFSVLPIFLILCLKAERPLVSIIKGWFYLFLITIPFAIYELVFDFHLPSAQSELDLYIGFGEKRKYAAITFGNLNGYNQMMVYSLPFIFSTFFLKKTIFRFSFLPLLTIVILLCLIITNSSRAAVICMVITLGLFLFQKQTLVSRKLKFFFLLSLVGVVLVFFDSIFVNIVARLSNVNREAFGDSYREEIIYSGLKAMKEGYYMGAGPGNFEPIISRYTNFGNKFDFIASHNLFLEIGVEYGLLVLVMFICYLVNIFLKRKVSQIGQFIIVSSLLCYPISHVISSSYFLAASTWMFLFSIQMFSIFNFKNQNIK